MIFGCSLSYLYFEFYNKFLSVYELNDFNIYLNMRLMDN